MWRMKTLTRDGTAEPVSLEQFLRRERRQGKNTEQERQPYPVDPYSAESADLTYSTTSYGHTYTTDPYSAESADHTYSTISYGYTYTTDPSAESAVHKYSTINTWCKLWLAIHTILINTLVKVLTIHTYRTS